MVDRRDSCRPYRRQLSRVRRRLERGGPSPFRGLWNAVVADDPDDRVDSGWVFPQALFAAAENITGIHLNQEVLASSEFTLVTVRAILPPAAEEYTSRLRDAGWDARALHPCRHQLPHRRDMVAGSNAPIVAEVRLQRAFPTSTRAGAEVDVVIPWLRRGDTHAPVRDVARAGTGR